MSDQTITQGPGNLVPDSVSKQFLAGATITKGMLVAIKSGESTASYTVVVADGDAAATSCVVGIAEESAASGAWFNVCVKGYCPYILADGSVTTGVMMVPDAPSGAANGYATDVGAGVEHLAFGVALSTDSGAGSVVDGIIFGRFA